MDNLISITISVTVYLLYAITCTGRQESKVLCTMAHLKVKVIQNQYLLRGSKYESKDLKKKVFVALPDQDESTVAQVNTLMLVMFHKLTIKTRDILLQPSGMYLIQGCL